MTKSSQVMQNVRQGRRHADIIDVDPGHIYDMPELGLLDGDQRDGHTQQITFLKRSGGAIQYEEEWSGIQTQTLYRVAIRRTRYLNSILPCAESERAIRHSQNALWEYEARAFRRKIQALNREQPAHVEDIPVPFSPMDCETHPLGADGHLSWLEAAMLYVATFGLTDYEPWPQFWFCAEGPPVPRGDLSNEQLRITRLYEYGIPEVGT